MTLSVVFGTIRIMSKDTDNYPELPSVVTSHILRKSLELYIMYTGHMLMLWITIIKNNLKLR